MYYGLHMYTVYFLYRGGGGGILELSVYLRKPNSNNKAISVSFQDQPGAFLVWSFSEWTPVNEKTNLALSIELP